MSVVWCETWTGGGKPVHQYERIKGWSWVHAQHIFHFQELSFLSESHTFIFLAHNGSRCSVLLEDWGWLWKITCTPSHTHKIIKEQTPHLHRLWTNQHHVNVKDPKVMNYVWESWLWVRSSNPVAWTLDRGRFRSQALMKGRSRARETPRRAPGWSQGVRSHMGLLWNERWPLTSSLVQKCTRFSISKPGVKWDNLKQHGRPV